jgi:hypothetical protein
MSGMRIPSLRHAARAGMIAAQEEGGTPGLANVRE